MVITTKKSILTRPFFSYKEQKWRLQEITGSDLGEFLEIFINVNL